VGGQGIANDSSGISLELSLAGLAKFCQTPRPIFCRRHRRRTLSRRWFHFSCRLARLAAVVTPLLSQGGCAMFHQDFWNMDRYRDERAVDVDSRLQKNETIVKSPF